MNKRDRMKEQILHHGFDLNRIFDTAYGPVELCKKIHRVEVRAHRLAEDYCNGVIDTSEMDKKHDGILDSANRILGFRDKGIPVFFNQDPRGYALKIQDDYVKNHAVDIYKDWGGYGILAPEFDGNI